MHWAAPLIGLPYAPGARGPKAYDCLGLVQHVVRLRLGVELPDVRAVRGSAWKPVQGAPLADDVVIFTSHGTGPNSRRHIGFMVGLNPEGSPSRLAVLHANGTAARLGGCVVCQDLGDVSRDGWGQYQFWRLDGDG